MNHMFSVHLRPEFNIFNGLSSDSDGPSPFMKWTIHLRPPFTCHKLLCSVVEIRDTRTGGPSMDGRLRPLRPAFIIGGGQHFKKISENVVSE